MQPEESGSELNDLLANSPDGSEGQPQETFRDDNGQGERLLATSRPQESQTEKLLAGKYKSPQDLEKGYLSQNKGFRELQGRAKQLEQLVQNPRIHELAAQDPDLAQALSKLGVELQQQDTRRDEDQSGGAWNGDTNDPRFLIEVVNQRHQLQWDLSKFERKLGRDLTDNEVGSIKAQVRMAPRLTIEQAWKLTPHFEKELAAKQQKAIEQARRGPAVNRPRPVSPTSLGGPRNDAARNAVGLKEGDKASFIQDLIDKAERS